MPNFPLLPTSSTQNANSISTAAAKEVAIAIICTSNHSQSPLKEICSIRCIYNTLNIGRRRQKRIVAVRTIGRVLERTGTEGTESISLVDRRRDLDLETEETRRIRRERGRDHRHHLQRIRSK